MVPRFVIEMKSMIRRPVIGEVIIDRNREIDERRKICRMQPPRVQWVLRDYVVIKIKLI